MDAIMPCARPPNANDMGSTVVNKIECYDDTGKVLWTRDQNDRSVTAMQSLAMDDFDHGSGFRFF